MNDLHAVVFDTDGVLLATADRHAAAWKETFDGCLTEWQPSPPGARPRRVHMADPNLAAQNTVFSGTGTSVSGSGPADSAAASLRHPWARCPWLCPGTGTNAWPQARNGGARPPGADPVATPCSRGGAIARRTLWMYQTLEGEGDGQAA